MGMTGKRAPLEQRFWAKVAKGGPEECWLWLATKNNHGYGMIWAGKPDGNKTLAHRVSYELHFGPIPTDTTLYHGITVLHRCDTPACVNPAHLFLGTQTINVADKVQKGRHRWGHNPNNKPPIFRGEDHYFRKHPEMVKRGEAVHNAKLTNADVLDIWRRRLRGESHGVIARNYSLDRSTVKDICDGERWGHLLAKDGAPTIEQLQAVPNAKPKTKLQAADIPTIRAMMVTGLNNHQIADKYGVHHATISDIRRGVTWAGA
jgi:hypothetical protein